jgi:poly(3-hydroxybutyrate) depolymerase
MRAKMNGCAKSATTYPSIDTITTTWNDCKAGAVVQNIRINGGGHMWGQISNDLLWQFLSRFSL